MNLQEGKKLSFKPKTACLIPMAHMVEGENGITIFEAVSESHEHTVRSTLWCIYAGNHIQIYIHTCTHTYMHKYIHTHACTHTNDKCTMWSLSTPLFPYL